MDPQQNIPNTNGAAGEAQKRPKAAAHKFPTLHPALNFGHGWAAVGIEDETGKAWLIGSDAAQVKELNAKAQFDQGRVSPAPYDHRPHRGRWARADVEAFLTNPSGPTFGEALACVRERLLRFAEFKRVEDATVIACWIIGTYFYLIFPAFPRLNFLGPRGTGKTKVLQVIAAIGFNGMHFVEPTPAIIFRLIEPCRPTLCLDEMERLGQNESRALGALLNASYKAGTTVARVEGEARRVETYEVYAPIALAGIKGINAVTEDRAITFTMEHGVDPKTINSTIDSRDPQFGPVRAMLYRLTLTRFNEVQRTPSVPAWLQARPRELFGPLLTIATLADQPEDRGFRRDVLKVARRVVDERVDISEEARALFLAIERQLGNADTVTLYPKDLVAEVSDELGLVERDRMKPEAVAAILRRYDFPRLPHTKHGTPYRFTRADFVERAMRARYAFTEFEPSPEPPSGVAFDAQLGASS